MKSDRIRFEENAKANGITNFTILEDTKLEFISLNGKMKTSFTFNENGKMINYTTTILN